jgi:hypothetical protein
MFNEAQGQLTFTFIQLPINQTKDCGFILQFAQPYRDIVAASSKL